MKPELQAPNWRYTFYEDGKAISTMELVDRAPQYGIDALMELAVSARTGEITYKEEKING